MTEETVTPLLCLAGPTASGKSAAARAIAERWPVEIINVDSATIYRGMDIGTAKPDDTERAQVRHHLLDILEPAERYSAAAFRRDALQCVREIRLRGNIPLLAGGTMLYFKALRDGLHDLPSADKSVREDLEHRAALLGWPSMHQELSRIDPVTASRLAPNDSQRIQRALEIWTITGKPMSAWLSQTNAADPPVPTITLSLEPSDRAVLHQRIADRFDVMLEHGLVDEVRRLKERQDLHAGLPSIRCVGYRQIWSMLDGECSLPQARDQAIFATRQLAKRQITWLRSQPAREAFDSLASESLNRVIDRVAHYMKTAVKQTA